MKKRMLVSTLVVLVGLGAGLSANAQQWHGRMAARQGFGHGARLLAMLDNQHVRAALNLTDEQVGKLRQIIVNEEKASIRTRADIAIQAIDLRELLMQNQPDHDAVMKTVDELSTLHGQMMKNRISALLEAKQVLTPEQQQKIRSFIEQRMWAHQREGHGGGAMMMRRNRMMRHGMGGGMMRPGGAPPNPQQPPAPPAN